MTFFIKLLIRFIDPYLLGKKNNWFSKRYSRIESQLRKERFQTHKRDSENSTYFHVHGAGDIEISNGAYSSCGGAKNGYSIGIEWGEYGFSGGVISRADAIKLANHIYNNLNTNYYKESIPL